MKKINFNRISIKNFLSVGNTPVVIDFKPGLHIITGVNKDKEDRRNGVGKSTIADSIYFAVFGETLRDLKKEFIINNINKKTCEVILDAEVNNFNKKENIQIIRTLDPSKCYVYVDGVDVTRDSIANTNELIQSKFECTTEIFQNCVIMTLNNTIPFMAKKKHEKRKFIEDIFNLSVFSSMLNNVKVDYTNQKKEFDILTARFEEASNTLDTLTKQKNNFLNDKKIKYEKYTTRKENNKKEIKQIEDKITKTSVIKTDQFDIKIQDLLNKKDKASKKIEELKSNITTNLTLASELEKKYNNIGTEHDLCPVCLRGIQEKDKQHIKEEKNKINQQIINFKKEIELEKKEVSKYNFAIEKLTQDIDGIKQEKHNFALQLQEIENLKNRLEQLRKWQDELDCDLRDLESSQDTHDKTIHESENKVALIASEIEKIKTVINKLDAVKFVMSEEGVKSFILKKILQIFNSKLAYYLKEMDSNCICTFNEYFEENIIDDKGKECSYFNFSGAERKNIDLACLFTFMDIRRLQGDVSFNFSIYDELFDSSLDEKGVELVVNILKERVKKYNECAMVISHRRESIKSATGDIIFLEKNNGITRKVDYREYIVDKQEL